MTSTPDAMLASTLSEIAEAELRKAMFDAAGVMAGVFELLDHEYRYALANRAVAEFYGCAPEDMLGKTGGDLGLSAAQVAERMALLRYCWDTGKTLKREYLFTHDRRASWFLGTFSPLRGETPRISFVLVDVTERKHAELEVKRQQARLDLALRAGGLGFWEYDIAKDEVSWDELTREMFGVGLDAPIDYATYASRLDPAEAEAVAQTYGAALKGENGGRYKVEHRATGRDGRERWIRGFGQVLFDGAGQPTHVLGTVQDISEEVESSTRRALMVAELNHRVKNNLATVQSLAAQTARRATSLAQFMGDFEGRIVALARTHDVLTANDWTGASLQVLLARELDNYRDRVSLEGPDVDLSSARSLAIALVTHELATNAAKYGALSNATGTVHIAWSSEAGRLRLTWRESGGPTVSPPSSEGFGTRLITSLARGDLDGAAETTFRPGGIIFRLEAPL